MGNITTTSACQQAPGPRQWSALKLVADVQRDPLSTLETLTHTYGDLVRFQVLAWPLYLVTHPDHIKYILQENYLQYNKDIFNYRLLKVFLGRGLLTNEGASWLSQRRLIQPAFHRQHIATFGTLSEDERGRRASRAICDEEWISTQLPNKSYDAILPPVHL